MGGCAQTPKPAETAEAEVPIQPAAMHPESLTKPESLVYPWSVVPGGVFSREAARQAVDRDPIVEEHYRAVRVANLRSEQLTKAKSAYVSYRKGDTIYWTRNPVLLKAGETVLTDGESMIRGRCGNMVSETPRTPVAPVHLEPPPPAMEVPVPASRLVAAIPPALSREDPEPGRVVTDRAPSINTSILPSPTPVQGLPGYSPMGAIGFVPVAGGGGGTPAASNPAPDSPPPAVTRPPGETTTPPPIHPPIPIVVTPLTPPGPPTGPPRLQPPPEWPTHWYPPPRETPLPPPPVHYPPPDHPPGPPPPHRPPPSQPPYQPPPSGPPPSQPPPPHKPPPSDPPHFPPPPSDPPFDPPPPEPPPAVPEPTPFVLIGLGMIGLGLHLSRRQKE